jgi:energy-coupling factor transporter ATP-binding protein EcfA2
MDSTLEFGFKYPFGEESCEHELKVLQNSYKDYYYNFSRFNAEALDEEVYLIVGRRGSGKTSLTKYFNFQDKIKNAHSIDVDEPHVYSDILEGMADKLSMSADLAVNGVSKIWDYLIWSLLFNEYQDKDGLIKTANLMVRRGNASHFIHDLLSGLVKRYVDDTGKVAEEVSGITTSALFTSAQKKILEFTRKEPAIIAIDTFERYDRENMAMMVVTAALIQRANEFNITYAHKGIHVKAFVSAEIFPHIKESIITNTTKFIRHPVYLRWKPRDLIRLIMWRFQRYMEAQGYKFPFKEVVWENFDDILEKLWFPFFGRRVKNLRGVEEQSFPYILRHTQMRPRQLVVLCNHIARQAINSGKFPQFKEVSIGKAISECEYDLADEVLNSYDLIYPRVAEIITALTNAPMMFQGNYLDQVAKRTSSAWPRGDYTTANFRRVVAELGIVGKVRTKDDSTGIIAADFEYAMPDRLTLTSDDLCVIHPMFYSKLQVKRNGYIVYPFPDHEDYNGLWTK